MVRFAMFRPNKYPNKIKKHPVRDEISSRCHPNCKHLNDDNAVRANRDYPPVPGMSFKEEHAAACTLPASLGVFLSLLFSFITFLNHILY